MQKFAGLDNFPESGNGSAWSDGGRCPELELIIALASLGKKKPKSSRNDDSPWPPWR
jgi:hypothetical protein